MINESSEICTIRQPLPALLNCYIPEVFFDFVERFSGKKIIVVNEQEDDVTDSFIKEDIITKSYLITSKLCKYKLVDIDYEKIERNKVYIYKTIFYPPKSKSPKIS